MNSTKDSTFEIGGGFGLFDPARLHAGLAEWQAEAALGRTLPPVEHWNPQACGRIDLRIARDGTWFYLGTPIARPALVRLFSTILRREADGTYVLVTPAERAEIVVEDAPFLAVRADISGEGASQSIRFLTNVGDHVAADQDHSIRVAFDLVSQEPRPYVLVRGRLEARIARPVFYELVDRAEIRNVDGGAHLGVMSGGVFHVLGPDPGP